MLESKPITMRKVITLLLFFSFISLAKSQNWTRIEPSSVRNSGERKIKPNTFLLARIDDADIKKRLWKSPSENSRSENALVIKVMLSDGSVDEFKIRSYEMMEARLAAEFPNFKTFVGSSQLNPLRSIRIDYTLNGFRALITEPGQSTFIDPYQTGDVNTRVIYTRKEISKHDDWRCLVENKKIDAPQSSSDRFAGDCKLRTYRLAVAATGEYTAFHGGTVASGQAAIVTAMNRVNQVFEQDISVRMILVANNSSLVYTDGATDPYTNNSASTLLTENITNLDNVIGNANYDIGHVFCTTDSGVAYRPSVCDNGLKGGGVTGQPNPVNDPFWIDYVAHEMGHQFGGNHTQNNDCNRASGAAMEPGSGSTIMGYAGICSPNVQNNSDPHFHANSIAEMTAHITGTNCASVLNISNSAPIINAVQNYTVPKSTFLVLEASATDSDNNDALTYCWEQMDPEVGVMPPQSTNPSGPVFRSISPSASGKRYLPNIQAIISNTTPTWEVLPSVSRTMKFRATVRDHIASLGCTDETDMTITVDGSSGPFTVSESISGTSQTGGQSISYTWNVAGTNNAPVSCSNVDILLSTDGGLTYPTTVLANTPNDGSQSITIPSITTSTARLMVRCSDNIFFDINNQDFAISGGPAPSFTMSAEPASGTVCNNSSIQYTLNTTSIGGFSTPIGLTVSGMPSGASITASPASITPGNSSTITLSNFGANVGNFTITLTGTAGSVVKTAAYDLTLTSVTEKPTLVAPANSSTNVASTSTFNWNTVAGATSYKLQIGTSSGVSNTINQDFAVTSVEVSNLAENTAYFWRVIAINNCGNSVASDEFTFTTASNGSQICTTFSSPNVPIDILDETDAVSVLNVNGVSSNITDIDVVNLVGTHSYVSDLSFTLSAPSSGPQNHILISQICTSEDNFNLILSDEGGNSIPCPPTDGMAYKPVTPLSAFDGLNPNGDWTLRIADNVEGDEGVLTSWGLRVCYVSSGDFTIATSPANGTVCNNSSIQFDITSTSIGGFSDPVTLSASGLPSGAAASFSTNPLTPGNASTVTLSNFGNAEGNFTIQFTGVAGGITKTSNYALTLSPTPGIPTLTSPADNATAVSQNPTLSWIAGSNAVSYDVQVSASQDFSNPVFNSNVNATQTSITGLTGNTNYFWRVRAVNPCGNSAFSSAFSFTTAPSPDFTLATSPSSGSVCNNSSIQFDITSTSIGGFSDPVTLSASGLPSGATASFSTNPLTPGNASTVTLSNFGNAEGNFTIQFTGVAGGITKTSNYALTLSPTPGIPTLTLPADNATTVSQNPTLSWNASSNAVNYDVQVSASQDFSNPVFNSNINGTQTSITGLIGNTNYFWRVRAVNPCGNSAFSSAFSFTTAGTTTEVCTTYASTDVPRNIGVNDIFEYTSNLNIPLNQNITDLDVVNLEGTHTYIADLEFILRGPDNTQVTLFSEICNDEDNFDLNFDDEAASGALPCPPISGLVYQPAGQLSDFDGKNANGDWTLVLRDLYQNDDGMLNSWGLKVCYESAGGCNLTVTSTNPTGVASLMDALACAQAGNTIIIDLPTNSIINLDSHSLLITKNLNIISNNPIFIDHPSAGVAIEIKSGAQLNMKNVTIRQLP